MGDHGFDIGFCCVLKFEVLLTHSCETVVYTQMRQQLRGMTMLISLLWLREPDESSLQRFPVNTK